MLRRDKAWLPHAWLATDPARFGLIYLDRDTGFCAACRKARDACHVNDPFASVFSRSIAAVRMHMGDKLRGSLWESGVGF